MNVAYVTNRPPSGSSFGPPPMPVAVGPLSAGWVGVDPSGRPEAAGRVTGIRPAATVREVLVQAFAEAAAAHGAVLVMVHGYNYSFQEAVARAADFCQQLEQEPPFPALTPVMFTWPSTDGGLSPDTYLADRSRAAASEWAFAALMGCLGEVWAELGQPPMFFHAHSMGVYVTQLGMAATDTSALAPGLFKQAIVIGGDADVDAFSAGRGLDKLAEIAGCVTIGVNVADFATGVTARHILGLPRLGSSGPDGALPGNVVVVDYTLAVGAEQSTIPPGETGWNYRDHQYYRTVAAALLDQAEILSGTGPDQIGQRVPSRAYAASGVPGIQPGRLYVAPEFCTSQPVLADIDVPDRRG